MLAERERERERERQRETETDRQTDSVTTIPVLRSSTGDGVNMVSINEDFYQCSNKRATHSTYTLTIEDEH